MKKNIAFPYFFIAPAVLLFAIFTVFPVVSSFILSFQQSVDGEYVFSGLSNYMRLLGDEIFLKALENTFLILIIQVPIMILLALILASALNNQMLKLKGFFRTSFFMPAVTSLVAYAVVFSTMLQDDGIFNSFLSLVGIDAIPWLSHPFWAKVSIILAMTWRWTGYNMVIFLAALQNVSEEIYEAASLDGAGKWQKFFYITVPQLKPVILFSMILSTIGTLQLFDEPLNLTKGGPADSTMTLGLYIYQNGFQYFDFGYASAIAYVVVILVAILSFLQFKVTGED
ncbi:carbohydrate ABC transporter permease [Bacillus toyonensis]|uniref:carbohydrate ABC transporter permease n=1 Tax=Bacillus toyonensis TaxID=155322 RepID=UPI000BF1C896|nr:sugar ABC transporter permease [Bacillus toyonensis]PEK06759.1 lactose ABC transporter permease [Bacillus toyonensis]PGA49708.1 lactose ABC transporter permease [Bacillus toyonensis]PGB94361.1 lactose ABC transporter permease [Bacillus toyonensis]PGD52875.1 lactose ABC transporter permease [Bacillus toyonensis]PGE36920.1 lactose ABC transporter permease [Bacillus toyonensis]